MARLHEGEQEGRRALAACLREHLRAVPSEYPACAVLVVRPGGHVGHTHEADAPPPPPALANLTERVRSQIRGTDHVVTEPRSGALAIVLHDAGSAGARAVAGRLCAALDGGTMDPRVLALGVRLSLGYSSAGLLAPHNSAQVVRTAWRTRHLITVHLSASARPAARQPILDAARIALDAPVTRVVRGERRASVVALEHEPRKVEVVEARPDSDALRTAAQALGVPYARIPPCLPAACRRAIAPELARALRAVPIGRTRGVLTIAMQNPTDTRTVLQLRGATGLTVFPVLADADEIERALAQLTGE